MSPDDIFLLNDGVSGAKTEAKRVVSLSLPKTPDDARQMRRCREREQSSLGHGRNERPHPIAIADKANNPNTYLFFMTLPSYRVNSKTLRHTRQTAGELKSSKYYKITQPSSLPPRRTQSPTKAATSTYIHRSTDLANGRAQAQSDSFHDRKFSAFNNLSRFRPPPPLYSPAHFSGSFPEFVNLGKLRPNGPFITIATSGYQQEFTPDSADPNIKRLDL